MSKAILNSYVIADVLAMIGWWAANQNLQYIVAVAYRVLLLEWLKHQIGHEQC